MEEWLLKGSIQQWHYRKSHRSPAALQSWLCCIRKVEKSSEPQGTPGPGSSSLLVRKRFRKTVSSEEPVPTGWDPEKATALPPWITVLLFFKVRKSDPASWDCYIEDPTPTPTRSEILTGVGRRGLFNSSMICQPQEDWTQLGILSLKKYSPF